MMRENYKVFFIGLILTSFIELGATAQVTKTTKPGTQKTPVVKKDYQVWYDTIYTYRSWRAIDTTSYRYSTTKYKICADTKGTIYCIGNDKKIYKVIEDKFIDISPNKEPCNGLRINDADEVLLETWGAPDFKSKYYLFRSGTWEPVTDKDLIAAFLNSSGGYESPGRQLSNKPADPSFLKKTGLLYYPRNRYIFYGSSGTKGSIYEFVNNQWKKLNEFSWGNLNPNEGTFRQDMIFTNHGLYSLINGTLYKQDTSFTISIVENREYYNKKVPVIVRANDQQEAESYNPGYIGIFEQDGKLGLRTIKGQIIAHPVFKSIVLEKNPSIEMDKEFTFHLKGDSMDVFCFKSNEDPDHLYGYIESIKPCAKCEGTGKLKQTQLPCNVCDGGKRATTITRNKYEFDRSTRKYISRFDISYMGLDLKIRTQ